MRKTHTIGLLLAIPLSVCNAQTDEVVVSLTMPDGEMLILETTPIVISISNGSDRAFQIIKDNARALRYQIKLDVGAREPYQHSPIEATDDRYKNWSSVSRSEDYLAPGESFTWIFPRFVELTLLGYHTQSTNITAKVLVGDNKWAYSATVPFCVSREDIEGGGLLPKSQIIECYNANTKMKSETTIRKVKIGNKSYLFTDNGYRICAVSDDDVPEVFMDSETGMMSISFKDGKRRVIYNFNQKKVESDEN
ncbi:MAG: hypothetical protein FWG50_12095 [Kiritimatiellaeota bacterium]|nr:hypothetical protein [Kiritimatiellota bacterium]